MMGGKDLVQSMKYMRDTHLQMMGGKDKEQNPITAGLYVI
jgi:hypothetical protein